MKSQEQKFIQWAYRNRHVPWILLTCIIAGIVLSIKLEDLMTPGYSMAGPLRAMVTLGLAGNSIILIAVIYARIAYRRRPHCPACGIDAVDCKIQRNTILPHRKNLD